MRGRGIDFKHKFNTSRWAEDLLIRSLDNALGFKTVRYGIAVAHFFDQEAFAVALGKVSAFRQKYMADGADQKKLQVTSGIFAKIQDYDRVDMQGAGEQKPVFVITPAAAEKIGDITDVKVSSQVDLSGSKKYVSHVIFTGGKIQISKGFLEFLISLSNPK
jgi:hypothetical protein